MLPYWLRKGCAGNQAHPDLSLSAPFRDTAPSETSARCNLALGFAPLPSVTRIRA